MANTYFQFKQFTVHQELSAMKVTTDACLFGAWAAMQIRDGIATHAAENSGIDYTILDIGTGTGLLSLMIAQECDAFIDAIEIDEGAYEQAAQNMAASPWHDKLFVMQGDIKEMIPVLGKQFDIIVSNPPFYENELEGENKYRNIAHHSAGLLLNELLSILSRVMKPDGQFYLLLPYKRDKELEALFLQHELVITRKALVRQSTKHDFFRIMIQGKVNGADNVNPVVEEIAIWNDKKEYTKEFRELLGDYYLNL